MSSEVKLNLPDELILQHVKLAVAQALGTGDTPALVERVVTMAMTKQGRYSKHSLWEDAVEKMVLQVAEDTFRAWVEKNRAAIEKGISAALDRSKKPLVKALVDGVFQSVKQYRKINVSFNIDPE